MAGLSIVEQATPPSLERSRILCDFAAKPLSCVKRDENAYEEANERYRKGDSFADQKDSLVVQLRTETQQAADAESC